MDLSVILPTLNERENLAILVPRLRAVLASILPASRYEILVVDAGSSDGTAEVAGELADRVVRQSRPGYGQALKEGFAAARGEHVATLDADLSHEPSFLPGMWQECASADILIASRYVPGGRADMSWGRKVLSRILNLVFRTVLALPLRDMSSGFRLYHRSVLHSIGLEGIDFDILPEIVVRSLAGGWRVRELPFHYSPRQYGGSKARLLRFGRSYLTTLGRLWRLQHSLAGGHGER